MTVSDGDMTKLTNIPASEAGPPLAEHGENPKDSQLPQFTHFRSKFSTTILVLNIRHSLSHTSWKRVNVFPSLTLLWWGQPWSWRWYARDDLTVYQCVRKDQLFNNFDLSHHQKLSGHIIFQVHQEGRHRKGTHASHRLRGCNIWTH